MQNKDIVRIESVTINNFKNVVHGQIDLTNKKSELDSSVVGIFGQNGSGKTTLIDVISLLKQLLMGEHIDNKYFNFINVDSDKLNISYKLSIKNNDENLEYQIVYDICLGKKINNIIDEIHQDSIEQNTISSETLSISKKINGTIKASMTPWIQTNENVESFEPKVKYDILTGKNKDNNVDVLVAQKIAMKETKSFIFSKELYEIFKGNCTSEDFLYVYKMLKIYSFTGLFIFDNKNSAITNLDTLPVLFRFLNETGGSAGEVIIPIDGNGIIPLESLDIINKIIKNMNIVLEQLVPGLTISIKKLGDELLKNGTNGCRVQLLSNKNGKTIPLCYESDGIKKIIAILQLFIAVYNQSSITVVIDELDSGIFEYLLGEILSIISNNGKGQLIFTCHNLRPLETLDKSSIIFTTTNPLDRYKRLTKVKKTNNLRDLYYRSIILTEMFDNLYDETNNSEISFAFKEACSKS